MEISLVLSVIRSAGSSILLCWLPASERYNGTLFKKEHLIARNVPLWNLLRQYIKHIPSQRDLY